LSERNNHKVDDTLKGWKTPFDDKEASWKAINHKLEAQKSDSGRLVPMYSFLKVAAAVVLVLGLTWFMMPSAPDFQANTQAGEHTELTLPDGSTVILNAMSSLSYDMDDFADERELNLEGEAFFKVMKGSSFTVHSSQGDVTVLGTSFNVNSRNEFFHVTCETGKVKVDRGGANVILTPGKEVRSAGKTLTDILESSYKTSWMDGRFLFVERPTSEVFEELERQFGIEINSTLKDAGLFTGEFERTDLESALEVVCNTMGLTYELDPVGMIVLVRTNN
jgi:ferric-dicitrate binding protein FerR (iron transport regulator)